MQCLDVILPGGLPNNGGIEQHARFHPLNGRIEQQLIESQNKVDHLDYVTVVLSATLDRIGDVLVDEGTAADLCVADREYLMLCLASIVNGEQMWLQETCGHCATPFDVEVRRGDLPVKRAGQGFPMVQVNVNNVSIGVRVPTGSDQKKIAHLSDSEAMTQLLRLCIRSVNGEDADADFIDTLREVDIEAIDVALDEASPAVCNRLLVNCPECAHQQHAELDHYQLSGLDEQFLYEEVHTLASHYHWSENAILELPQSRRRRYLGLINRTTGMVE